MTVLTSATVPVAQIRKELAYLIERGERAKSTLAAINLLFPADPEPGPSAGHAYGNGEPDAELAKAAGIRYPGRARPSVWREYLSLRRSGVPATTASWKARLNPATARKLEKLV